MTERDGGLIRFLMRERHGSPFEHGYFRFLVKAPIFVVREHHRHRAGHCLPGGATIWLETIAPRAGRLLRKRSLGELYRNWHEGVYDSLGRVRLLPACRNLSTRVLNEESQLFELGRMSDVYRTGTKEIYLLRSETHSLRCSVDHRVLTSDGWACAGELRAGDHIAVAGVRTTQSQYKTAGSTFVRLLAQPVRVAEEETYDIEMEGPHHNFVADGVVVHNSYNEWSGRYSKLEAEFYVPEFVRTQVGKPGAYTFEPVDEATREATRREIEEAAARAFETYERLLEQGVAKEVARSVLPLATYTKYYWSCNPRSLMHFCGLRNHEAAQYEIRQYAAAAESFLAELMPITHEAFVANDRTAP
jgi:thymidylate synthase ThyX